MFEGIDDVISDHLGVADYKTRTAAKMLVSRTAVINGTEFVNAFFESLKRNWLRALPDAKPSRKNFRWRVPQLVLAHQNNSLEVTLERKLIRACENAGRSDWTNQVPVLSGIMGRNARQAVDFVHRIQGGFEFVELKVQSGTPLYASVEFFYTEHFGCSGDKVEYILITLTIQFLTHRLCG